VIAIAIESWNVILVSWLVNHQCLVECYNTIIPPPPPLPPEVLVCVLGADINCPEEKNLWTPLHLAVRHNQPQVVR